MEYRAWREVRYERIAEELAARQQLAEAKAVVMRIYAEELGCVLGLLPEHVECDADAAAAVAAFEAPDYAEQLGHRSKAVAVWLTETYPVLRDVLRERAMWLVNTRMSAFAAAFRSSANPHAPRETAMAAVQESLFSFSAFPATHALIQFAASEAVEDDPAQWTLPQRAEFIELVRLVDLGVEAHLAGIPVLDLKGCAVLDSDSKSNADGQQQE
jgi:hypothetical protein